MSCTRNAEVHDLIDGTLGRIRAAELEQHIDRCDDCRALADDLRQLRDTAASLDPMPAPDHVWLQIAGRLRQEGRVHDRPAPEPVAGRQYVWLAIAAALVLTIGASILVLIPRGRDAGNGTLATQSNAVANDPVQSGVQDLREAERLLQSGVAKLKEGLGSDQEALPEAVTATLDTNLKILDSAIAESSTALQENPQDPAARNSLFDALQRKISLLQDTIALMNAMQKGNAAGVAQAVDGSVNKS